MVNVQEFSEELALHLGMEFHPMRIEVRVRESSYNDNIFFVNYDVRHKTFDWHFGGGMMVNVASDEDEILNRLVTEAKMAFAVLRKIRG